MIKNVRIFARHVAGLDNEKSDWLSHGKISDFKEKYGNKHNPEPCEIPEEIWPVEKIWLK